MRVRAVDRPPVRCRVASARGSRASGARRRAPVAPRATRRAARGQSTTTERKTRCTGSSERIRSRPDHRRAAWLAPLGNLDAAQFRRRSYRVRARSRSNRSRSPTRNAPRFHNGIPRTTVPGAQAALGRQRSEGVLAGIAWTVVRPGDGLRLENRSFVRHTPRSGGHVRRNRGLDRVVFPQSGGVPEPRWAPVRRAWSYSSNGSTQRAWRSDMRTLAIDPNLVFVLRLPIELDVAVDRLGRSKHTTRSVARIRCTRLRSPAIAGWEPRRSCAHRHRRRGVRRLDRPAGCPIGNDADDHTERLRVGVIRTPRTDRRRRDPCGRRRDLLPRSVVAGLVEQPRVADVRNDRCSDGDDFGFHHRFANRIPR